MRKPQNKLVVKVLLTGGHGVTTALSMVEEFAEKSDKKRTWEIYWVGAEKAFEGKDVPTLESKVFPKLGVIYYPIIAGKLQMRPTFWSLISLIKVPIGFFHAIVILTKVKPDVILSFGGFASFPVVVVGFLFGIPIVLHDQTAVYGRANKLSSFFATKIALARRESYEFFPREKSLVVGNPVMKKITKVIPKEKPGTPPTIYITGGSRGSRFVNNLIEEILKKLLRDFRVIHYTGHLDFAKFRKMRTSFTRALKENYEVYASIDPTKIDSVYKKADIIVSRAGANTVAEILFVKRPALLIPLPFAYKNEQKKNADIAQKFGIAKVLEQGQLTSSRLYKEITETLANWQEIVSSVKNKKSPDELAAAKLADLVQDVIK